MFRILILASVVLLTANCRPRHNSEVRAMDGTLGGKQVGNAAKLVDIAMTSASERGTSNWCTGLVTGPLTVMTLASCVKDKRASIGGVAAEKMFVHPGYRHPKKYADLPELSILKSFKNIAILVFPERSISVLAPQTPGNSLEEVVEDGLYYYLQVPRTSDSRRQPAAEVLRYSTPYFIGRDDVEIQESHISVRSVANYETIASDTGSPIIRVVGKREEVVGLYVLPYQSNTSAPLTYQMLRLDFDQDGMRDFIAEIKSKSSASLEYILQQ